MVVGSSNSSTASMGESGLGRMNKKVQLISFVLACVVVFFHAGHGPDPMHTKVMAIAAQNVAVPFFFVISGYFFMKRYDGSSGGGGRR